MRKDDYTTLNDYLQRLKSICDSLAAAGKPVSDLTKAFSLLNGLGDKYDNFVTFMLKPPIPSFTELVLLLQGYETWIACCNTDTTDQIVLFGQKITNHKKAAGSLPNNEAQLVRKKNPTIQCNASFAVTWGMKFETVGFALIATLYANT